MPIADKKFSGWCCVYADPPDSEDTKRGIEDIPKPILQQWVQKKFQLNNGQSCPVRLDHWGKKFDIGLITDSKMAPTGETFCYFEVDMSKELGKEIGAYLDRCEKEKIPVGCSIGHEVCVDMDTGVAEWYNLEEVSLCGRGAREHTIILPPNLVKSLETMTIAASKGTIKYTPMVSEVIESNFKTLVRVMCSRKQARMSGMF